MALLRRVTWHFSRIRERLDRRTVALLLGSIVVFVAAAALIVTLVEGPITFDQFGESFYWALNTVLGAGDPTFVSSFIGRAMSALLTILGLTLLTIATGLLIGFIIDVLLKEGQGMGAAAYRDHIVVCGWNASARELIDELHGDDYAKKIVLLCERERNPAGHGVYFVHGDPTL